MPLLRNIKLNLENIIHAIRGNRYRITDHADEEAPADELLTNEIFFSAINGEIIEDYPENMPYLRCLI